VLDQQSGSDESAATLVRAAVPLPQRPAGVQPVGELAGVVPAALLLEIRAQLDCLTAHDRTQPDHLPHSHPALDWGPAHGSGALEEPTAPLP
jgi:hypothetical protein